VTRANRSLYLPVLLSLMGIVSCKCGDGQTGTLNPCETVPNVEPGNARACSDDSNCHEQFPCTGVKDREGLMCCIATSRKCSREADCCAGQQCSSSQRCVDKFDNCTEDASCGNDGRVCVPYQDALGNTTKRCQFKKCSALGECEPGLSCFQGECVAGLPCGGACEAGKACLAKANFCQEYSCPATCAPGYIRTFKTPDTAWNYCKREQTQCECAELPGISSKDLGRFSALTVDPSTANLWVSAYDGQYGDLVLTRYDETGKRTKQEYVDGVPADGVATWGPSGARGGVEALGPDVGRYSDIAFFGTRTFVSYYDVTNGNLKMAKRQADDTWSTLTVDGAHGDVGLYTSIAVDSDGYPAIAYFQKGGASTFDVATCPGTVPTGAKANITALKLARAKNQNPGPSDFNVMTLACMSRVDASCDTCTGLCADPSGTPGPGCYPQATGCGTCADDQLCVSVSGTPTCAKRHTPTNLLEVQDGVGLFTSLAFKGKDAYIAFMRRESHDGNLQGIVVSSTGTRTGPYTLDFSGDVGYFPDLKLQPDSSQIWLSYFDGGSGALKIFRGSSFASGSVTVVDPGHGGAGSGEVSLVGADSAIGFSPTGQTVIVYQDATRSDLKIAVARGSNWEKLLPIRTEGAVGFFADIVFSKNHFFISHARLGTKSVGGNPTIANGLLLERITPP